jgi:hypothetical protein
VQKLAADKGSASDVPSPENLFKGSVASERDDTRRLHRPRQQPILAPMTTSCLGFGFGFREFFPFLSLSKGSIRLVEMTMRMCV